MPTVLYTYYYYNGQMLLNMPFGWILLIQEQKTMNLRYTKRITSIWATILSFARSETFFQVLTSCLAFWSIVTESLVTKLLAPGPTATVRSGGIITSSFPLGLFLRFFWIENPLVFPLPFIICPSVIHKNIKIKDSRKLQHQFITKKNTLQKGNRCIDLRHGIFHMKSLQTSTSKLITIYK